VANEITVQSSLRINKGKLSYQSLPQSFQASLTATNGPSPGVITASTIGTDVSFTQLVQPGMCRIMNLDLINFITVGIYDTQVNEFYPLMELLPGESYVFRISRWLGREMSGAVAGTGTVGPTTRIRVKANLLSCYTLVEAFDS
jgi:hypothetical protein